ncbi:MAG: DNA polymerase III subunit beta [Bacteroidales bacterium]|nr:DNA polymerase III subunit beta [Bacteroidales bacterium]
MKFIVSRDVLFKSLNIIGGVINSNNSLNILDNFLFVVEGEQLTITASDLETTMSASIELTNVEGEGAVAVPAKLLLETLKLIPETPIVFVFDLEAMFLKFTAANGEYDSPCYPSNEFPTITPIENPESFTIEPLVLQRAISKTLFAAANDEMRPNMTGVLCELSSENITFVATDAHKLVRYRNTKVKTEDFNSFIFPRKPLSQLKGVLQTVTENVTVAFSSTTNHVQFSFENVLLYTRLKDGKFPNYETVIPTENPNKLIISRDELLKCIRRMGIFASQSTYQIRVSLSEERINITAEDIDFSNKAEEDVSGIYSGEPLEIGFNSKFLREMLENMDAPEIRIEMSQPNRAAIILPTEEFMPEENLLMLIMPVMLGNY